jgi:uncharacterized protein (TIGR02678 family)
VGEQVLISALVDQIRADAAEQGVTITDGISDRRQLVTALRLLAGWGVVSETDGSLTAWGERREDEALLSINRSLLIHLLPNPLHQFAAAQDTWSQEPRPQADPPRRRLRRRLVENPAVFRAELPDDEQDALSRDRHELARHLDENFGLVLEVRAEGVLAYDPSGTLTDLDFPGSGSAKQAALLLLDELTAALRPSAESAVVVDGSVLPGALAAWPQVDAALSGLAARFRSAWKGAYVESVGTLRADVTRLLEALRLARATEEGLAVFPFAARYQPHVRTLAAAGGEVRQ